MRLLKTLLLSIVTISFSFQSNAQENLNLTAPDIDPAPMGNVANLGAGCFKFNILNINNPGYPAAGATQVTIVMQNLMPADGISSLTTDPQESAYAWDYDGAFTIVGTQINPIGQFFDEEVTICFTVEGDSPCPAEDNGFTATGEILIGSDGNTNDNVASSFTCTLETVFPVTYGSFNATKKGATSQLTWTTESEVNNERFDVQRSSDGQSFKVIGQVAGVGNSTQRNNYEFIDENPLEGKNYYRLAQIDFDNTQNLSSIRTVVFDANTKIVLYPNPAISVVYLELTDAVERVEILDVSGKKLKSIDAHSSNMIDLKDLHSGVYLARFIDVHGNEISSEKLIVSK